MNSNLKKDLMFAAIVAGCGSFVLLAQPAFAQQSQESRGSQERRGIEDGQQSQSSERKLQDPVVKKPQVAKGTDEGKKTDLEKAHADFAKLLSGSKFVGNFTIVGQKKDLTPEEYVITEVKKMDEGDYWLFKVRIKYMTYDVKVGVPLQVKWAGDTPVITVDGEKIPGLGTFDARVVIHQNKYSGTWAHGKVGGHLFGTIERAKPGDEDKAESKESKKKDGDAEVDPAIDRN